jgi:hypothetical protein
LQSLDYAYTVNGWLKALNHPSLAKALNFKTDVDINDVFASKLQYFSNDFNRTNSPYNYTQTGIAPYNFNATNQLYNGNIGAILTSNVSSLQTGNAILDATKFHVHDYRYDELNRLLTASYGQRNNSTGVYALQPNNGYKEIFSYDANGNIKTASRNDIPSTAAGAASLVRIVDNLTYKYDPALINNQLLNYIEPASTTYTVTTATDLRPTSTSTTFVNYKYDASGNLIIDNKEGLGSVASNTQGIFWNAAGKMSKIIKTVGAVVTTIEYFYDAMGNRVAKSKLVSPAVLPTWEYYVRDAKGNTMANYARTAGVGATTVTVTTTEQPIYGSARLGTLQPGTSFNMSATSLIASVFPPLITANPAIVLRTVGLKTYEITDHLGNVRNIITDNRIYDRTGSGTVASPFVYTNARTRDQAIYNYYAFGMPKISAYDYKEATSVGYRYGFGGKEKLNEVMGEGNFVDLGERGLDTRLGRLNWKCDPLAKSFPWNSPYAYAENDVIRCIDLDGLEKVVVFGGADLMNTGLSKTTIQTAADIQKFSDDNKLGYEVKTYNVAPWNPSHGTAFQWIKDNYKKGESIIIYGYSMGGVAATQLTKMLKTEGITVNLLVPVDGAWGFMSEPLQIPDNVETVFNFYQTDRSNFPVKSRGYEAKPQEGNNKTVILNDNMTGKTTGKKSDAHGTMADDTQKDATNIIKAEMMGKLDGIIQNATSPAPTTPAPTKKTP